LDRPAIRARAAAQVRAVRRCRQGRRQLPGRMGYCPREPPPGVKAVAIDGRATSTPDTCWPGPLSSRRSWVRTPVLGGGLDVDGGG